jgi:hypothetical protein
MDKPETKPFQIKMKPEGHALLKQLASTYEITIGDFIQNLIIAHQRRVYQTMLDKNVVIGNGTDRLIGELLIFKDCGSITDTTVDKAIVIANREQAKYSLKENRDNLAVITRTSSLATRIIKALKKED